MSVEGLLQQYGYAAIVLGTLLEGETVVILGGLAAHLGYLHLPWVIACAFAGTFFGDQLYFFLGRWRGPSILASRPSWQANAERVLGMLERHRVLLILGFRFLYGLRTVTPFVIGMTRVSVAHFMVLNTLGALVWSLVVGALGYGFGEAFQVFIGRLKRYELAVMGGVAVLGALLWVVHFLRQRRLVRRASRVKGEESHLRQEGP
jgi:membrane protein DedA with SNARE-associated domain